MPELQELNYQEVTRRLRKLGFHFYRRGKGSHELWVRDADGSGPGTALSGQEDPQRNNPRHHPRNRRDHT